MFRKIKTRQLIADVIGASVFFAVFVLFVGAIGADQSAGAAVADVVVLALFSLALTFRRLSPQLALGIAWIAAIVQMTALRDVQPGNLAVLTILYAVGSYGSHIVRWLGLASAVVGTILSSMYLMVWLPSAQQPSSLTTTPGLFIFTIVASFAVMAMPWTLGMMVAARRASQESKIRQLEAQREAERAEYAVVVEQERNRIARDMHDVVAHSLAVVIAQADGARYAAQSNPGLASESLTTIAATAREALADVRLLLAELRHSEAEGPQPTIHDLERLIEQLRLTGLRIIVDSAGDVVAMSASHQIAVFRIVQEALTNALRHGDSSKPVDLVLEWGADGVRVVVTSAVGPSASHHSNAAGGASTGATASLGHGIPGMRERAILTGGTFTAGGTGDGHFVVNAWIPSGIVTAPITQPKGTP